MKNKDSVELIEYTKAQDALNCVTHALGAIFGAAVLVLLIKKAAPFDSAFFGWYRSRGFGVVSRYKVHLGKV